MGLTEAGSEGARDSCGRNGIDSLFGFGASRAMLCDLSPVAEGCACNGEMDGCRRARRI